MRGTGEARVPPSEWCPELHEGVVDDRPDDYALKLVNAGWAPSGATIGGEFMPGVEVAGRTADA